MDSRFNTAGMTEGEPGKFSEVIVTYDNIRNHWQFAGRINRPF